LSVILNYIEGYSRIGDKQYKNFLRISYGSLKESKYLIYFSFREGYIKKMIIIQLINLSLKKLERMLWKTIQGIKDKP